MSRELRARLLAGFGLLLVWSFVPAVCSAQTKGPKTTFRGYLSEAQEPGAPNDSNATAVGTIQFDAYLTQATINVYLKNLDPSQIAAFHLHCGLPGQLGPLVVNFNTFGAFTQTFTKVNSNTYLFSETLTDANVDEANWPPTPVPPPPACAANAVGPAPATTVAGLDSLARAGQLYFNLHTGSGTDNTFVFGLIRGQIYSLKKQQFVP